MGEEEEATGIEALERLYEGRGPGEPPGGLQVDSVRLGAIQVAPEAFQPRDYVRVSRPDIERNVRQLSKAPRHGSALDPLLVMPIAGQWWSCPASVDG